MAMTSGSSWSASRNGRWGKATELRGPGGLNAGPDGDDMSLSCGAAGDCAASGDYVDRSGSYQGFVAIERNGRWGKATGVPGLAALNAAGVAEVDEVSCGAAGDCAASGHAGATADMDDAGISSVSCAPAGNCAAGGYYTDRRHHGQGFVVAERNGRWGKATEVPGLGALNTAADAAVISVSCASAGNCAAGGCYKAATAAGRGSSSSSGTAAGARRSRCPAWVP